MEKSLLAKLDPKSKEHQRKKVLRIFFTWNAKQSGPKDSDPQFWDWVRGLSPDNLNSSERFKSMSYEFLDKLISKVLFRNLFSDWISNIYMPSLTKSIEDEHTRHFLQFAMNCIEIKRSIELKKQDLLVNFPNIGISTVSILKAADFPTSPGVYLEFLCPKSNCIYCKTKSYGYLGIDIGFNCLALITEATCPLCNSPLKTINFGLCSCRFLLTGATNSQKIEPLKDVVNYYNTLDEFHFYAWTEMTLQVASISEEEKEYLDGLVLASFSDPSVPKKKYCKRKEVECLPKAEVDFEVVENVLALEKESRELDAMIYDLVADNYRNSVLIQELKERMQGTGR
jgi:hypothetical protein